MGKEEEKEILNNKRKYFNFDEQRSQDVLQSRHGKLFKVVVLLVELSEIILKPNGYLE